jgi:hypothetical protein
VGRKGEGGAYTEGLGSRACGDVVGALAVVGGVRGPALRFAW